MAFTFRRGPLANKGALDPGELYIADEGKLYLKNSIGVEQTYDMTPTLTAYVDNAIAGLVASAPGTLDTLNELALALGDDPNFATTIANSLATKVPNTRTVAGKALSADINLTKSDVGLGNVDNTADALKNIGGNAATVTNGVYTSDSRLSDQRIPVNNSVNYLKLTGDMKQWRIANGFSTADQLIVPHSTLPNNFAIANVVGIYSWFYKINRFNWDPANGFNSSSYHPAFLVAGVEREIYAPKFTACLLDANGLPNNGSGIYAGSRPFVQQMSYVNFDQARAYCNANNGGGITGYHLMTLAEWAALQIRAIAGGTQPYGNTNWGKDDRDPSIVGRCYSLPAFGTSSDQARWLTGSGGVKTSHNFDNSGVYDLSGNVWKWLGGMRLNDGEIQIFANNDAANSAIDQSATSTAWLAILDNGTLVAPGTAGTLRISAAGNITKAIQTGSGNKNFESITCEADVSASSAGVALLMSLGLYPYTTGLNGDGFWWNLTGEFVLFRGGYCGNGGNCGVSSCYVSSGRGGSNWSIGFPLAFVQ